MSNPASYFIKDGKGNLQTFEPNLDPTKGAKQDAGNALLESILAGIAALAGAPPTGGATAANQTTLIGHVDGLEGALAAILAKIIALPATEAKQDALAALFGTVTASPTANTVLARLKDLLTGIVLATGENHVGAIGGNTAYVDVTLVVDTALYTSGDVLSDRVAIPNAMRINDGTGVLQSITVLDESDQASLAFDLVFLSADLTLGTVNVGASINDANARSVLGVVSVAASDFVDLGASKVATRTGLGLVVKPSSATRIIYVGAIARSTPTFLAASDVKLRLGFLQD